MKTPFLSLLYKTENAGNPRIKLLPGILFLSLLIGLSAPGYSQRLKDIAYFRGVQSEQLIGYGLVVGLAGSGDSYRSTFTVQSVTSMLKRFGITMPDANLRTRNVAAVMVTASVNSYLKAGSEFDVTVSSMGDATSLMGGTLLMAPLSGKDGTVYGTSQGPISVGGYDISTGSGGRVTKNHALTGRIPSGGVMQQELSGGTQIPNDEITILLRKPDFTTANNIMQAINLKYSDSLALAVDASEIHVRIPVDKQKNLTMFLADMESVTVMTDAIAKVVLNERTGTVVAGSNVRILPVTISHGNLKISVSSNPVISQPEAFSQGKTIFFNNLTPTVEKEDSTAAVSIKGASNVSEVAAALNSLKVSPRDIIAIFQALKESGALIAELVIM
jgi:flagellar P-ring protein precursor FlgI